MKEYRIKAKSAERRKAIIGALEGLGYRWANGNGKEDMGQTIIAARTLASEKVIHAFPTGVYDITHTSLDSMIEDIIRDRQTVEVKYDGDTIAIVSPDHVRIKTLMGDELHLENHTWDRIAEAVAKVRGAE